MLLTCVIFRAVTTLAEQKETYTYLPFPHHRPIKMSAVENVTKEQHQPTMLSEM